MNTNRIRTSSVLLLWTILLITAHTPVQSQHGGISGKAGSYLSSFPQGLMVGPYIPATPMGAFEGTVLGGTPVNDLCDNAVVENLAAGGSVVRTGDNTGATDNLDLGVGQVWEAFTITECLDVSISYCGTTPAFQGALTFLVLGCPLDNLARTPDAQVDQTACVDGNYTIRFPQLPAGTYYYPVLSAPNAIGPYTLTISGQPCAAVPPANDDCTGAIALTPASVCISITGDVNGANAGVSLPAVTCEGFNGSAMDDVWFSFVATAETHTITVQGSDQFDTTVDLRSGACGTTTNIACADITGRGGQEVLPAAGLTVGETYYVRVNDWYGGLPITTTFTICVTGPDLGDCLADAGTIASAGGQVCFVEGSASLQATAAGNAVVPSGYSTIYVLTEGPGLVISNTATEPSFTVNAEGNFTIHTLVYDPNTLDLGIVVPGVTTGFDVNALLIQGGGTICGSLDVTGAPFTVAECTTICDADAGSLAPLDADVCLVENSAVVVANIVVEAVVPTGYDLLYVLTQGQDLVIINAGSLPFFTVDATGTYTIHTLVYDGLTLDLSNVQLGITTAAEVNALLIQGGGTVCASLDVTGAAFTVSDCSTLCLADAGTLTTTNSQVCFVDGSASLQATPAGNAVVPSGYSTIFVLTEGPGLVISNTATEPSFTVNAEGDYTIHTLVYDPNTLDLGIVVPGETTGFDVNALLIQGGGTICGSLDVTGAPFSVSECTVICDADAGTLEALDPDVCLEENTAVVVANIVDQAVVPSGFDLLYVLTQGQDLVIINAGSLPFFTVDAAGTYTIHTLVYDGLTLDLSNVQLGITTAAEVNALLIQGGGTVCASLDVTGAAFTVSDCSTLCIADAGTLTAETTTYCLVDGQVVVLASANGDAVVPTGFQMAYALTEGPGLVIRVISNDPVFTVSQPGSYTIHTLVYDPATVDPGAVEIDVTTGFDLNALLIQGGGTICGALDVTGAQITVLDCSPVNDDCSNAIALNVNQTGNCLPVAGDNTYAADNDDLPGCDNTNVGFADVWYSFLAGENTSVELVLDPGNMTDWGITVNSDCGGTELLCAVRPDGPLSLATEPGNTYWVRVWTNLQSGAGGAFTLCVTGSAPTVQCDGGSVTTSTGSSSESVCQDALSDVLSFTATTSSSEAYTFIVTDEAGAILTPLANDALDFNGVPLGTYRVWGISHNGNLVGVSSGADLAAVTSAGECLELSSNFVTVSVELCTGMNEATTADWMLFPNPGNGDFTLLPAYSGSNVDLDVLDQRGRIVHQERISVVKGEPIAIALGARPTPGVYTVRMSGNAHMNTLRLVVY